MFSHATQASLSIIFRQEVSNKRCSDQRMSNKVREVI